MWRLILLLSALSAAICAPLARADESEKSATQPLQVAADALPEHPERGPFLFCYFFGNGDGLHLAWSSDGLQMTPLANDAIFLKPSIGGGLMRDPCIRQGPDGVYHLVWTTGWWDKGFGVSSSPDLVHWGPQQFVDVNKDNPTAINTWAPELFYNNQKQQWMVFWATTIPGKFAETEPPSGKGDSGPNKNQPLNHRIYYVTTSDFNTWSPPMLLVDPGFNCIDATIAKIPANGTPLAGKFVMVLKDETIVPVAKKNLRVLTSDSPEGPWSAALESHYERLGRGTDDYASRRRLVHLLRRIPQSNLRRGAHDGFQNIRSRARELCLPQRSAARHRVSGNPGGAGAAEKHRG